MFIFIGSDMSKSIPVNMHSAKPKNQRMPYKGKAGKAGKHQPLQDEIANDSLAQGKGRSKKRERQPEDDFMTDAMSNKVLLQARKQLDEVEGGIKQTQSAPTARSSRSRLTWLAARRG